MPKHTLFCALIVLAATIPASAQPISLQPRPVILGKELLRWEFTSADSGWQQLNDCVAALDGGLMRITSRGEDPNVVSPPIRLDGPLIVQLRLRSSTAGSGEIFWTTQASPQWSPAQGRSFRIRHNGQWHDYQVLLDTDQVITQLRLDPGSAPGTVEVDWIRLASGRLHPLEVRAIECRDGRITVRLRNHSTGPLDCDVQGQSQRIAGGTEQAVPIAADSPAAFDVVMVTIRSNGLPDIRLPVCLYNSRAQVQWVRRQAGNLAMEIAPDGSGARFLLNSQLVAIAGPLVRMGDKIPAMTCTDVSSDALEFRGHNLTMRLGLSPEGARIAIQSAEVLEGPVLRVMGSLDQGLLAGVEYLGKQERSSSTLDIETEDHWRVRPDPLSVTMPLMACVTDQAAAALLWDDPSLQPVFATPNFLDGAGDHRMALEGGKIDATMYVGPSQPLEQVIAWAVRKRGLPPLPDRPRKEPAQRELLLRAFMQSVAGDAGWGHAAEGRWERRPYADVASAIGRLSGEWPKLSALVSGGAHIRNDAAYFLTHRADQWLRERSAEARNLLAEQQPDGSFRYDGPYRRGHSENTASGYNAWRATLLLDHARLTGDRDSLAGGIRCLEFMKRFRTPRGAQTHELPLHTPDLLGSAYLVWAYARGYELTGNREYLDCARKWALSGVPFIYQWSSYPTMSYASIPAFGATQWVEPNWIGLPVQWCGLVYGYALAILAPHDPSLDWKQLAQGILIVAEKMQYPDGPLAGCLPDFFLLPEQRRGGPSVNPGALLSLQLALEGRTDSLAVASDGQHRVTAPFPVTLKGPRARIDAPAGAEYQVVVDGKKIVEVVSRGIDEVDLGP